MVKMIDCRRVGHVTCANSAFVSLIYSVIFIIYSQIYESAGGGLMTRIVLDFIGVIRDHSRIDVLFYVSYQKTPRGVLITKYNTPINNKVNKARPAKRGGLCFHFFET